MGRRTINMVAIDLPHWWVVAGILIGFLADRTVVMICNEELAELAEEEQSRVLKILGCLGVYEWDEINHDLDLKADIHVAYGRLERQNMASVV